jgi:hypothetical protein
MNFSREQRREIIHIINERIDMEQALAQAGADFYFSNSGSCDCPFHGDTTRSAKFHPDTNSLYCFSCGRKFGAFDVLKDLFGLTLDQMWQMIIENEWVYSPEAIISSEIFSQNCLVEAEQLRSRFIAGSVGVSEYVTRLKAMLLPGKLTKEQ